MPITTTIATQISTITTTATATATAIAIVATTKTTATTTTTIFTQVASSTSTSASSSSTSVSSSTSSISQPLNCINYRNNNNSLKNNIYNNNNNNIKQKNETNMKKATLVEEEDFNELIAVPKSTIVIAGKGNGGRCSTTTTTTRLTRHLPPLKLNGKIQGTAQGPSATIAATLRNVLQRQSVSASTSSSISVSNRNSISTSASASASAAVSISTTKGISQLLKISKNISEESPNINELTPLVEHQTRNISNNHINKSKRDPEKISNSYNFNNSNNNKGNNNNVKTVYQAINTNGIALATSVAAVSAAAVSAVGLSTTTTTTIATTTKYSHNSKTTRSWPVIYRNSQHYDYEALHAQLYGANNLPQPSPVTYIPPASSASFRQNCYSNQFQQSIVYSSSNEDLTTINESVANGINENTSGDGHGDGDGGYGDNDLVKSCFNRNSVNASASGRYKPHNPQDQYQKQTTCYYFTSNHHNSIYEQPSKTKHFDATNATTVDSLRHNNSLLLLHDNYSSKIMQQTTSNGCNGALDTSNAITSAIGGGAQADNGTCCTNCCIGPPPILFLFITLLMTTSATAMLCAAIMTDHWEHVTWDRESLDKYTNRSGLHLDWLMDQKIAMLKPHKKVDYRFRRDTLFLVPMHGGIWTLCIDLPLHELQELRHHPKFPPSAPTCLNYLAGSSENARGEEQRNDWQHSESQNKLQPHLRMQNLSISCSLVCLIILGSAALVGAFGVCQRQISAILITGVMYLLAALFALFTLMIIHFKRQQGRPMLDSDYDGTVDGIVARPGGAAILAKPLLGARVFLTSWSLDLGWGGVALCAITSVLWILLSKIMRYNPFSTLMI